MILAACGQDPAPPSLPDSLVASAKARGIEFGVHVQPADLESEVRKDMLRQIGGSVLVDGQLYWGKVEGDFNNPNSGNFADAEPLLQFADSIGARQIGHHGIWGMQRVLPTWIKNSNPDSARIEALVQGRAQQLARLNLDVVSVVNEALNTGTDDREGLSRNFFVEHYGDSASVEANALKLVKFTFPVFRQAMPGSVLMLNDYGNHDRFSDSTKTRSEAFYHLVKEAKAQGIPIDAVGFQMHITDRGISVANVVRTIESYRDLGVEVYFTEVDVDVTAISDDQAVRETRQAEIFADIARSAIDGKATGLVLFGLSGEKYLARDGRWKPAYDAMKAEFDKPTS